MADDSYWVKNFNTKLTPDNEVRFKNWVDVQSKKRGRDLNNDLNNYDLRGYWEGGGHSDSEKGHMPDTYKKPNHDSFSDESKYHGTPDNNSGGRYQGGRWIGDDENGWSYQPSARMLQTTHNSNQLRQYFADNEPDVMLLMPTFNKR
jgi:hypothetical protein